MGQCIGAVGWYLHPQNMTMMVLFLMMMTIALWWGWAWFSAPHKRPTISAAALQPFFHASRPCLCDSLKRSLSNFQRLFSSARNSGNRRAWQMIRPAVCAAYPYIAWSALFKVLDIVKKWLLISISVYPCNNILSDLGSGPEKPSREISEMPEIWNYINPWWFCC